MGTEPPRSSCKLFEAPNELVGVPSQPVETHTGLVRCSTEPVSPSTGSVGWPDGSGETPTNSVWPSIGSLGWSTGSVETPTNSVA